MRSLLVLLLQACLCANSWADEWNSVHRAGVEAYRRGAYEEAATLFASAAPLAAMPVERAINASDRGAALHAAGRVVEARQWFESAMAIWLPLPGHGDTMVETALGLCDTARAAGDFSAAEKTLRTALVVGITVEHRAQLQNELADMLREQDRIAESRPLFEATLHLKGISNIREIEALLGVADLDRRVLRFDTSIDEWARAIRLARTEGDATQEALGLRGLGTTRMNSGDLAGAEPLLRRSLEMIRREGAHPRQTAATLSCLAALYRVENKYSLAEEAWVEALGIFRKTAGEEHPQTAVIMESLADLYSAERRFDAATEYAAHALAIMRNALGPAAAATAGALGTVALVKQREMHTEAAAADYAAAIDILRRSNAMSDQIAVAIMSRYAEVLATLHRTQEAKEIRAEMKTFRGR